MRTLLRLNEVSLSYGETCVLDNVSLIVNEQSTLLIKGESGCGKTTLLRCMAFLEKIDSGSITYRENCVLKAKKAPSLPLAYREEISMVFQSLYLWKHLTVFQNIAVPLRMKKQSGDVQSAVTAILAKLNLSNLEGRYPLELSGGQQQRVALARGLVHAPRILLLDEITANLDGRSARKVFEAIEAIFDMGTSVVVVSHSGEVPNFLQKKILAFADNKWEVKSHER